MTEKRWAKKYDACVECGKTDRPHSSKGLCARCNDRKLYREERDRRGGVAKPRKAKEAPAGTLAAAMAGTGKPTCTVALPENLYRTLEKIGRLTNTPVDEVATLTIQNYFADIGISTGPGGER